LLAVAGAPAAAAPKPRGGDEDPNREVCKSRPVIGSRVARVRECHTAQQWEELRWMEREGLMRKQVNGDPGCSEAVNCNIRAGAKDSPI
jgi:hypothetical protein